MAAEAAQVVDPVTLCLQNMWRLHARVWQQQPSKTVIQKALELLPHTPGTMCPSTQDALLSILCSAVCRAAPPSREYVARLVKQIITAAEEQHQELSTALLELHTALLMQHGGSSGGGAQASTTWRYKTFYYSRQPSCAQLQPLQAQQHQNIMSALHHTCSSSSGQQDTGNSFHTAGSRPDLQQQQQQEEHQQQEQQQQQPELLSNSWVMPVSLQQRLQQAQEDMQQLLAAVDWPQDSAHYSGGHGVDQHMANALVPAAVSQQQQPQQPQELPHQQQAQQPPQQQPQQQPPQQQLQHNQGASSLDGSGLITIHSSDNMFEGGTGCHMWDAGFLLAEFVLNHPQRFAGRRVLEVGCGPGLVAACLCCSGASKVLLTDGDPQTLVNCLSNLSLNGHRDSTLLGSWREACGFVEGAPEGSSRPPCQHQVLACPLDWHEDVPGLSADIIVGSDICYDPEAVPSLVRLLRQLLKPVTEAHGAAAAAAAAAAAGASAAATAAAEPAGSHDGAPLPVAYVAITLRQDSTLQLFLDECAQAGLRVEEVPKDPEAWAAAGAETCVAGQAPTGSGWQVNSGVGQAVEAAASAPAVVFQELPALQDGQGRGRYALYRVCNADERCAVLARTAAAVRDPAGFSSTPAQDNSSVKNIDIDKRAAEHGSV